MDMTPRVLKVEIDPQPGSLVAARLVIVIGALVIRECALIGTKRGLELRMPLAPMRSTRRLPGVEITEPGLWAAVNAAALAAFDAAGGDATGALAAYSQRWAKAAATEAAAG